VQFFRRHYGAGPIHLLSLLACFAFSGYIVNAMYHEGDGKRILLWFVGAAILHDLVLFPLYALADRSAGWVNARRRPKALPVVPWINYVRVPAVISLILLAISFPLVLKLSDPAYQAATGLTQAPFEARYLLVVAVLFGVSAVLYAGRVGRAVVARRSAGAGAEAEGGVVAEPVAALGAPVGGGVSAPVGGVVAQPGSGVGVEPGPDPEGAGVGADPGAELGGGGSTEPTAGVGEISADRGVQPTTET
jgi:hypothetical protein